MSDGIETEVKGKRALERLEWVEERLEAIEGHITNVNTTLNNHMCSYQEQLGLLRDEVRWKFNLNITLLCGTIISLLAIVVALIIAMV